MDLETLFSLALLALYLFFQFAGRKKRPDERPNHGLPEHAPAPPRRGDREVSAPAGASGGSTHETEMDAALREIRQALGFPETAPERPAPPPARPPAPPAPQPRTKPAGTPLRTAREKAAPSALREAGSALQRSGPTALERVFAEDRFEARPAFQSEMTQRLKPRPVPARRIPSAAAEVQQSAETPSRRRAKDLRTRLRSADTAHEAFLLGEILGPRRGHRRGR